MLRFLAWAHVGSRVLCIHRATQKIMLGEDVEFDFVYIELATSMEHQMAILSVGVWNLEFSHQGMVAQGAKGVEEVKWEKGVDKDKRV